MVQFPDAAFVPHSKMRSRISDYCFNFFAFIISVIYRDNTEQIALQFNQRTSFVHTNDLVLVLKSILVYNVPIACIKKKFQTYKPA